MDGLEKYGFHDFDPMGEREIELNVKNTELSFKRNNIMIFLWKYILDNICMCSQVPARYNSILLSTYF